MHITARICGGSTKQQLCPDESGWGGMRVSCTERKRTWLEQRWFQGPGATRARTQPEHQLQIPSRGSILQRRLIPCLFVQPVLVCVRERRLRARRRLRSTGAHLGEQWPCLHLRGSAKRAHALLPSPPANTRNFRRRFWLPQCHKKSK